MTNKEKKIGLFKSLYLLWLTDKQEKALESGTWEDYIKATEKHFKTYYGLEIRDMVYCPDLPETKALLHRHGCMVVSIIFSGVNSRLKRNIYDNAKKTFVKNVLLEEQLP